MRRRMLRLLAPTGAAILLFTPAAGQRSAAALHEAATVFAGHEHITNRVYYEGLDPWQPVRVGVWDYAKPWKEQVPDEAPLPTIDDWVEQVTTSSSSSVRITSRWAST